MSTNFNIDETLTNDERGETRTLNDLPPSYNTSLRQQTNVNGSILFSTDNSACNFCENCHNQAKQKIKLLNRLCHTIKCFDVNVTAILSFHLWYIFLISMSYFFYLWGKAIYFGPKTINVDNIEDFFASLNVSIENKKNCK